MTAQKLLALLKKPIDLLVPLILHLYDASAGTDTATLLKSGNILDLLSTEFEHWLSFKR